jgi:formate hydrogenlyase subunit 3/multisubunit Na+/H+ antiporter MnhD subunit
MVNPIYIIAIALGVGFSLGIIGKFGTKISYFLLLLALGAMTYISGDWLYAFIYNGQTTAEIYTAGVKPPFSIVLTMDKYAAFFTLLINFVGLFSGFYLYEMFEKYGKNAMAVYLIFIMGMNGVVLTGDLFNLFVFVEIVAIAIAGLVLFEKGVHAFSAGFKYMLATGVISGFLLLGIIFAYYYTGTLNIVDIASSNILVVKGGSIAAFLILMAFILELKPFPANGWGLDVYEASHPGIAALISAGAATATYFVLSKLLMFLGDQWYPIVAFIGGLSFLASNLIGIKQTSVQRMLGYSSIGQVGLLMIVLGFRKYLGDSTDFIVFGLLISNYLGKAGLFWLSGIINKKKINDWRGLSPLHLFLMGTFVFTLLGLPPFPSFFAKWSLIMELASLNIEMVFVILIGSLFEAVYLLKWFGRSVQGELEKVTTKFNKIFPVFIFALLTYVIGYFSSQFVEVGKMIQWLPLFFVAFMFLVDRFLPVIIKNTLMIAALGYWTFMTFSAYTEFRVMFAVIFLIGGMIVLLSGYSKKGKRLGFYPLVALMFSGLALLLEAKTSLDFFFAWEFMTLGSYLLVLRGKNAEKAGLSYILFSLGGAYAMLIGFGLFTVDTGSQFLSALNLVNENASWILLALSIGFMVKIASPGLHIWLPDAYAEAEDDVTPMLSGILVKSGVFGLILVFLAIGDREIFGFSLLYILGWIGAIGSIVGNTLAAFQEDIKKLIAYSSIGQMGYILFALGMMNYLGWITAVAFTFNHFVFKSLLFLAAEGIIYRTKTRNMYEMGGLIRRMPVSFITTLVAIIAVSGLPPLFGFAGKWLSYQAVLQTKWYFQGFIVAVAGFIAFLYLFRLIFTVFLGMLKDRISRVKEAPFFMLLPQILLAVTLIGMSTFPGLILRPVGEFMQKYMPDNTITWANNAATSALGYWQPVVIITTVGGIFVLILAWLLFMARKSYRVKQFNITYQGERPDRPETTHFAYNFYAHYRKAVGFFEYPLTTNFWNHVSGNIKAIADFAQGWYTGNGQTYVIQLVLFIVVFYFYISGGMK